MIALLACWTPFHAAVNGHMRSKFANMQRGNASKPDMLPYASQSTSENVVAQENGSRACKNASAPYWRHTQREQAPNQRISAWCGTQRINEAARQARQGDATTTPGELRTCSPLTDDSIASLALSCCLPSSCCHTHLRWPDDTSRPVQLRGQTEW